VFKYLISLRESVFLKLFRSIVISKARSEPKTIEQKFLVSSISDSSELDLANLEMEYLRKRLKKTPYWAMGHALMADRALQGNNKNLALSSAYALKELGQSRLSSLFLGRALQLAGEYERSIENLAGQILDPRISSEREAILSLAVCFQTLARQEELEKLKTEFSESIPELRMLAVKQPVSTVANPTAKE